VQTAAKMADFRAETQAQNFYAESARSPRHWNPARRYRKAGPVHQRTALRSGGQGQLALLACLLDNLGRAIPYKRLVTVIGRKSDNWSTRHLLSQYMLVLREILLANKAPFVIATVQDVGYALCEIAENPRLTSRNRRSNGVSRLAKTVRHWRIAAGLTQTAVAKRSGVNRSYLSHLENGRRNPTLATLERLAKILNVAPGYFL
jgi:DNA-binding XRE family transcriptional regulator